ncbi:MAG: peptide deformylase [Candidatus Tagabacteria bacterium CG03_land_8_20_14_0_80_41_22]|uniref:Peptide deformylase n=1 Tax=Candidatus Tagabacteria bacterium CG03_land_8_20_14_0_80_41_22 TaxID=1975020 RepID=A0A2M7B9L0_9BACT|nr:MAG: peptide deformylase [Candidatus Tagabacteria bacterium CG03_land_8_20_14_0_80_41_22]
MKNQNSKITIIQKGNDILRKIAEEIPAQNIQSKEIRNVIGRLKKAISENEEAVAAAAPQIGKSLRIFVVTEYILSSHTKEDKKENYGYIVFINPKIIKKSRGQKMLTEGCLSVNNIYGAIKRFEKVKVEAYDENGKKFTRGASGLFSQVIQHEIDHLDGILFTDKALALKRILPQNNQSQNV